MRKQPLFLHEDCECPRSAFFTSARGVRYYAKWYGKKCFVFHTRSCPNRRSR
ncbi:hypothetical protein [Stigmatella erecta]|uniref:Uncharacterized protein n=1 Tax=Stigmatella erecta TaxID=83460 RepID=A0A1I0EIS6_9BACT|nr:hypothetical protein [Stigmatella erecta]SET45303.1 hypothetical protein SAMN05443639_1033 [Stigmatella erecta]